MQRQISNDENITAYSIYSKEKKRRTKINPIERL